MLVGGVVIQHDHALVERMISIDFEKFHFHYCHKGGFAIRYLLYRLNANNSYYVKD